MLTPEQLAAPGSEHAHQTAFFACLNSELVPRWPVLRFTHAVPNGGDRDLIVAGRLKAEGVKGGVWDVFAPVAIGAWHGLYIEFKKPTRRKAHRGGLSDEQWAYGLHVHSQGYATFVAYTWIEARDALIRYVTGQWS